jgi:hypothetical protein
MKVSSLLPKPEMTNPTATAIDKVANAMALTVTALMMDRGLSYETASSLAARCMPTFRLVASGDLSDESCVVIELGRNGNVTVHENDERAASYGNACNVRHRGVRVRQLLEETINSFPRVRDDHSPSIN